MIKIKFGKSQDNIKFGNGLLAGVRSKLMSPSEYFSRTYRITSKQKQQNTVPFLKDLVLASSQDPLTVRQNPVAPFTQRDRVNLQQYETLENSAFSGLLQNSMALDGIAAQTDASLTKAILAYGEQCPPILYRAIKGIRASQLGLHTGMKFENAAWQSTTRSKQQALLLAKGGTIFTLLIAPKLRVNVLDMTRFSSDKGKREVVLPKNATLQVGRIKEGKGEKPDAVIMQVSFPESQVEQELVSENQSATEGAGMTLSSKEAARFYNDFMRSSGIEYKPLDQGNLPVMANKDLRKWKQELDKAYDTYGADVGKPSVTQKNYGGRHDQQTHTTLFNLANPSQGRRGGIGDKKGGETHAGELATAATPIRAVDPAVARATEKTITELVDELGASGQLTGTEQEIKQKVTALLTEVENALPPATQIGPNSFVTTINANTFIAAARDGAGSMLEGTPDKMAAGLLQAMVTKLHKEMYDWKENPDKPMVNVLHSIGMARNATDELRERIGTNAWKNSAMQTRILRDADGKLCGVSLVDTQSYGRYQYVEYIGTNPMATNRAGETLMVHIAQSAVRAGGGIKLFSLRGAVRFYKKLGFKSADSQATEPELKRWGGGMELSREGAMALSQRQSSKELISLKNYAGRHDQQMHTTLFNLANPSQGRRGSGRDKKDEERRAYAGGPATTTTAGASAVASVDPQPTNNSAESRAVFTAQELARDERIYLMALPSYTVTALQHESEIAVRNAAMLIIKDSDKADVKAYQTYVSRLANAQLTNHIYTLQQHGNAGLIQPATTTASLESLTKMTRRFLIDSPESDVQVAQMQLNVAGKWTEAHERGRLALIKADQDIKDAISNMPAVIARGRERRGDELGTAIRLTREAQDIKAYEKILYDRVEHKLISIATQSYTTEVTKGLLDLKDNSKFWEAHEQIGLQAKLTPQEERGRLLFLSKGRELDRVTVEQMAKFFQAAPMQTNISAANLRQIMTEDSLKSGFETGSSGTDQGSRQYRGSVETAKMGYAEASMSIGSAQASDAALRPIYGYLGYKNAQDHSRQNLAGDYGQITAVMSPAVAPRVTVTQNDSLSGHLRHARIESGLDRGTNDAKGIETQSGNPFIPIQKLRGGDAASIRAFISQHQNVNERSIDWVSVLRQARERGTPTKLAFSPSWQRYMELQVHSGLKPSRDFTQIIVNFNEGGRALSRSAIAPTPTVLLQILKQFVTKLDESSTQMDGYEGKYGALKGLQIALARGIPVTVRHTDTGMEVPLIKVGGQRGLYSQSEWDSLLQTASSREKELRAYKTKNNKRESSRFGGGWIIPLLSIKGDKKDSTSKYMQSLIVPKTRANNGRFGADLILGLLAAKKRRLKPQAFRQQY